MKTIKRTTRKETTSSESTIVDSFDNEEQGAPERSREATMRRPVLGRGHAKRLPGDGGGNAPTDYEWTYLSRFEVKIGVGTNDRSASVFRNGRQQVKVDVYLTARDSNNNVVDLRKIYQNVMSHIDLVDERGYLLPAGWRVDWEPNGYQYNESFLANSRGKVVDDDSVTARVLEPAATADPLIVTYYVTTTSAYPLTISASITPPVPNAAAIRSGSTNAPDPGDHGSITIAPVEPPFLGMVSSEGLTGFYFGGVERYETDNDRVIDWHLSLRYANGPVELKELVYGDNASDPPCIQWHNGDWGPWEFHFVLTAQPGTGAGVSAGLPPRVKLSDGSLLATYAVYPSPTVKHERGKLTFMTRTMQKNHHFCNTNGATVDNRMWSTPSVIDVFGNIHHLTVEFPSNLDELAVRVSGRRNHTSYDHRGTTPVGKRTTRSETRRTETETVETVEEEGCPYPMPGEAPGYLRLPRLPSGHGSRPGATQWTRLTAFRVESVPSKSPGQTRTRVRVSLLAQTAAGDAVVIPDEELESILTLVDYDTGAALPAEWTIAHATEPTFSKRQQLADGRAAVQTFDFWVAATVLCPQSITVAASIRPPDGSAPIQTRPDQSGGGQDDFDSSVDIGTVGDPLWDFGDLKIIRESPSNKVFRNGVQQVKLRVELVFTDLSTGKPGAPDDELDTIGIAFADDSRPLPIGNSAPGWFATPGVASSDDLTYFNGFDFHPDVIPTEGGGTASPALPAASSFRYFYVACDAVQNTTARLCAYVKCRDGFTFFGNGKKYDGCGNELDGPPDDHLEVTAVAPENARIEQFPWTFETLTGDGDEETPPLNPDTVRLYTLSYVDSLQNVVGIRSVQVTPEKPIPPGGKDLSAMIQWSNRGQGESRACFTGYAQPGSTTVVWDNTVPNGAPLPLPTLPSADPRQASVLLVGRQNIPFISAAQNGPLVMTTTDWYGTTTSLEVRFSTKVGDGRWTLVLAK